MVNQLTVNILPTALCVDSLKTELERVEEEAMMEELVELVMMRDRLLWQLDDTKTR